MLELLVPNAAKATMAEEHKFLESGNWEKATSLHEAMHIAEVVLPGTNVHKAALPSTDAEEASCISNPKGS